MVTEPLQPLDATASEGPDAIDPRDADLVAAIRALHRSRPPDDVMARHVALLRAEQEKRRLRPARNATHLVYVAAVSSLVAGAGLAGLLSSQLGSSDRSAVSSTMTSTPVFSALSPTTGRREVADVNDPTTTGQSRDQSVASRSSTEPGATPSTTVPGAGSTADKTADPTDGSQTVAPTTTTTSSVTRPPTTTGSVTRPPTTTTRPPSHDWKCVGLRATIVGTNGPDVLIGTEGPDVIAGGNGRDIISGLGGDDTICGGNGRDRIDGGPGDDRLIGGNGKDEIVPGAGVDIIED